MKIIADLHVHSTYSDGLLTPKELFAWAKSINLNFFALTDHNTTAGCRDFIKFSKNNKLDNNSFISGIEFSCWEKDKNWHVLGLFIDPFAKSIIEFENRYFSSRIQRTNDMIKKLIELGLPITLEEFRKSYPQKNASRPHIALYLYEKKLVSSPQEAFDRWIAKGKPAYIKDYYKPSFEEVAKILKEAGGIVGLAHPLEKISIEELNNFTLEELLPLKEMKEANFDFIEVFHPRNKQQYEILINFTKKHNFKISGGSDFHGIKLCKEQLFGKFGLDKSYFNLLKE